MVRYIDPTGTKFWEIERDGATIVRRSGKLGTKGRAQSRTFASPVHARFEYGNFVGYKTWTEKYTAESPPPERRADDVPFDDDARLVHADALQAKGDPLGELIVLQHARSQTEDYQASQKLAREIDDLLDANAPAWFGDLWQARSLFDFEWRLGRLARVKLGREYTHDWGIQIARLLPDVPLCYQLGTLLEALFDLAIARSLEELDLATAGTLDLQHTMQKLVVHAPPTLRRLELHRSHGSNAAYEYGAALHAMAFPALEEFSCRLDLSDAAIRHVVAADWPNLHTLSFAMRGYSDALYPQVLPDEPASGISEVAPLFARTGTLRNLEIGTPSPTAIANAIIAGGALARLGKLVVRSRRVMDAQVEAELVRFNPNARYELELRPPG